MVSDRVVAVKVLGEDLLRRGRLGLVGVVLPGYYVVRHGGCAPVRRRRFHCFGPVVKGCHCGSLVGHRLVAETPVGFVFISVDKGLLLQVLGLSLVVANLLNFVFTPKAAFQRRPGCC